jgi:hypothetical protein
MIIIQKRRAGRAAYWGLIAFCALSLAARFVGSAASGNASLLDPSPLAVSLLGDARVHFAAILAAALAGYALPGKRGYPSEDNVGRGLLLAPLLGLVFLALNSEYGFNVDFWSGLQFGFLAGAVIPPREAKKDRT